MQTADGMAARAGPQSEHSKIFRAEYDGDLSPEARQAFRNLEADDPQRELIFKRLGISWVRASFELSQASLSIGTPAAEADAYRYFAFGLHPIQETSPEHQFKLWSNSLGY